MNTKKSIVSLFKEHFGGIGLRKKSISILILLITFIVLYQVGDKYHTSELISEKQSNIEKLFESNIIYNEAQEKYGIHSMGVSKSEKVLSVGMYDTNKKKEVQIYFEKQLLNIDVKDYTVEVLLN